MTARFAEGRRRWQNPRRRLRDVGCPKWVRWIWAGTGHPDRWPQNASHRKCAYGNITAGWCLNKASVHTKEIACPFTGGGDGSWPRKKCTFWGGKYCKNVQNMREERASKITEMQKLPKKDMRKRHQIGEGFRFYSPATVPSQLLPACCCRHPPKKGEMQKCSKFFGVNQKKCTEKPP